MARITRFPSGEGKLPVLPPSDYEPLPGLEEALRTLDDLLRLLDCARARGEDLTGSPVFFRNLEGVSDQISDICDALRQRWHA